MKHVMYITGGVSGAMMGYSWAWTFGLYDPCILLSGLTHAWSIWIFAVCILEYIIDFSAVGAANPHLLRFSQICPRLLHFGHFLCFSGIAASQLSLRIRPIYF